MSTTHSNPLQRPLRIILLALCVAIAGIGGYGVMQNLRVEELEQILAALETEKSKAVAEAGSLRGGAAAQEAQVKEMEAELTSLRAQVAESNLARAALDTPQALAALVQRNMQLQCTIQEGRVLLTDGTRVAELDLVSLQSTETH